MTLGFCGVVVLIGTDVLSGLGAAVWAQLACIAATLSYALAIIYGKRFRDTPPLVLSTGQCASATLFMLPLVLLIDRPWTLGMPSLPVSASLVGLAVVSTAFAYILYFRILKAAGATNASLVTLLVPVSAIVLSALFLGERLGMTDFAGMALIFLGLGAIDGRPLQWIRGRQSPARQPN